MEAYFKLPVYTRCSDCKTLSELAVVDSCESCDQSAHCRTTFPFFTGPPGVSYSPLRSDSSRRLGSSNVIYAVLTSFLFHPLSRSPSISTKSTQHHTSLPEGTSLQLSPISSNGPVGNNSIPVAILKPPHLLLDSRGPFSKRPAPNRYHSVLGALFETPLSLLLLLLLLSLLPSFDRPITRRFSSITKSLLRASFNFSQLLRLLSLPKCLQKGKPPPSSQSQKAAALSRRGPLPSTRTQSPRRSSPRVMTLHQRHQVQERPPRQPSPR